MTLHANLQYEEDLASIRDRLVTMGARVEAMVKDSITALEQGSLDIARQVIKRDLEVNRDEVELDEFCLQTIALRQPAAKDLRFITLALKIVTDMERIGDLAVNVGERTLQLADLHPLPLRAEILTMTDLVVNQLHNALQAFVEADTDLATKAIDADDEVDELYVHLFRELVAHSASNPEELEPALSQLFIGKYLERVGDHATNIAEMVIFMVKGKDIRHMSARPL